MAASGSILGNSVLRREDPTLITGAGKYFDDLRYDGMLHVHCVRSPLAHAKITGVDLGDSESMPGVRKVYTAANIGLADFQGFPMMPEAFNRPVIAGDTVRFVGDIVAVVIAETKAQAVDAGEAIVVDYDPLPVAATIEAAAAPDAPVLFPAHGSNVCFATALGEDVDALEGADKVGRVKMVSQRLAGVPMEPNGVVMVPNETGPGTLTAWISHQAPHAAHAAMAPSLGLEPEKLRVVCPWVGGGFGPKAAMYVEYLIAGKAALDLQVPVKWTETRSEDMVSLVHGRDYVIDIAMGVKDDGTIVGMQCEVTASAGAYPAIGAILPMLTQLMSTGVYNIPKINYKATTVVTNNTTIGAYRGAGRPEATQMLERVLDVAAAEIGMDPADIRRKNFMAPFTSPITTITGANYDSSDYGKPLEEVLKAAGYAELRAEQQRRRAANDAKLLGIGVSAYVEITAPVGLHMEYGKVEINEDGTATMYVGTSVHGQGHETAFSMVASEVLGIPMDKIKLVNSDTDRVPRGAGTMGSRSLQTAGSAVHVASTEVLSKAKQLAAHLLEANVDDIVKGDGGLQVAGVPAKAISWAELAVAANDAAKRPEGMDAGLVHELDFDEGDSTFPFGAHVAVVEVDRDTGKVTWVRHVAVDDCGRILNPMLVNGQQHGGIAQGAAQALFEWVQYDEDGNPITGNLMDYAMPSAAEMPSFEVSNTQTDSPRNPLGAKGIGESGTIGSTPAIHNAVCDAVAHLGVKHIDMPCTAERVWAAINTAG
ncbi:MAG: xanthine dehydrogenase family protein molybdopterin-binding subunit [Acidimicrobiia bacterium]